ncbi:peptidase s24-like domain-containing protein [Ditylenchus destructor]|uniref:Peptidase s24-like domain-containing protein n=1 Tax=Ditylenchus destructor TaxID=166010 RepID=A0AAD4MEV2_9BILA|nr:peptidase s24-like domain-containing protein [Ditylenchus destructor]
MGWAAPTQMSPIETHILHFPRTWLESITSTPPALLTFARGRGDSMQPTLQDGDIVLIDRSVRTIREQDAIWALTLGDIAMIKRVRIKNDRVSLLSDNDRIPPTKFTTKK